MYLDENIYNILWEHEENNESNEYRIFKLYTFKTL
jgi:hypothetical protein